VPEDQAYASKQLKLLAEKVKEFVPKVEISKEIEATKNAQEEEENVEKTKPERAIIRSVSQLISAYKNDENCTEEQKELEVNGDDEQSKAPEVNRNVKRVLENMEPTVAKKKMKHYESPLEFLKLPDISNRKYDISLNLKFLINLSFSAFPYDLTSKKIFDFIYI